MSLRVVAVVCFVLGVGLLVPFDRPVTLALGVAFLFAFIGCGMVALAGPGAALLADDEDGGPGARAAPKDAAAARPRGDPGGPSPGGAG